MSGHRGCKSLTVPVLPRTKAIGPRRTGMQSCGAFNPTIDFTAERPKVDWLGQKRLGATLKRPALGFRVAIGRNHNDRNIRPYRLRFGKEFKAAHPRHTDVGQDQNERLLTRIGDARNWCRAIAIPNLMNPSPRSSAAARRAWNRALNSRNVPSRRIAPIIASS